MIVADAAWADAAVDPKHRARRTTTIGTATKPTKAQTIASRLAHDIACGQLPPGANLDETAIAARYGVSRTPIREAIRQLTASGMLDTRAHRGATVRTYDERQLDDMFAVMADLEGLCARGAARAMTAAELAELDAIMARSAACVEAGDEDAYAVLNEQFHEAIYHGTHNSYLRDVTQDTRLRLAPFRRAQFGAERRLQLSLSEHARVVAAIKRRDAAEAFEMMRAHIVIVRDAVDAVVPVT